MINSLVRSHLTRRLLCPTSACGYPFVSVMRIINHGLMLAAMFKRVLSLEIYRCYIALFAFYSVLMVLPIMAVVGLLLATRSS